MRRTATVAKNAPRKDPRPITTLKPRIILKVAPKVAPAEIPKTYGSAIGLLTVDCMTLPHMERPAPTINPRKTRGNLIFQTIASVDFEISPISKGAPN